MFYLDFHAYDGEYQEYGKYVISEPNNLLLYQTIFQT